jgi:hypothetical protein
MAGEQHGMCELASTTRAVPVLKYHILWVCGRGGVDILCILNIVAVAKFSYM